jgi:hypothetical protein
MSLRRNMALKKEAGRSSEMSVDQYRTGRRYNRGRHSFHGPEVVKSQNTAYSMGYVEVCWGHVVA